MHEGTAQAGREAYDQTLAHYHTWFVRSGASIAMYSLPTKEVLLNRVSVYHLLKFTLLKYFTHLSNSLPVK